jgi:hypothetical protein
MLQRGLLSAAIITGKRLVVLVGTTKALAIAVPRINTGQKYTARWISRR